MNKDIVVIYHAWCNDGFGGAWSAYKKFGNSAEYIPAQHGSSPPELISKLLYLIDFTYPRNDMERLYGDNDVYILDHHLSAQSQLSDLPNTIFDMNRSGALIAWQYFHPDKNIPWFIEYISDADLWNWKLPESKIYNAFLKTLPFDFEVWDTLEDLQHSDISKLGMVALSAQKREIEYLLKTNDVITRNLEDIPAKIINYQGTLCSKLGEALYQDAPMSVCWFINGDKAFFSVRSNKNSNIDVSEICSKFGGGGHRSAGGFSLPIKRVPKEWRFWQ